MENRHKNEVVLGVDIGTTKIKCFAFDRLAAVLGSAEEKIIVLNTEDSKHEIEPLKLWNTFQNVVKKCLCNCDLGADDVSCLGIATQRGTFVTWDRETGDTYHNFITWKDKRAQNYCDYWNSSIVMKLFRFSAKLLHLVTRKELFQVASVLKFTSTMVLMRLKWVLDYFDQVRLHSTQNRVLFGTLDTWIVWKLTGGKVHATDGSNACVTGFFDPFKMQWATWILKFFNIPVNILPVVQNTSDSFGETLAEIFGESIPIQAVVGDQQSSMFGAGCFSKYDINCTMGTGSFLSVNTGCSPASAQSNVFPLVGWTINSRTTYIAECGVHDAGTIIDWAQNMGFFAEPQDSSDIAFSVSGSNGVYFLPAQNLFVSESKQSNECVILGLKIHSSKKHIVRAVLEAISFQVATLFDMITSRNVSSFQSSTFRICGGISRNNFIVQMISDLTAQPIVRFNFSETSSLGAAFLAGLSWGIWESETDIASIQKEFKFFYPSTESKKKHKKDFLNWKKCCIALQKF